MHGIACGGRLDVARPLTNTDNQILSCIVCERQRKTTGIYLCERQRKTTGTDSERQQGLTLKALELAA